MKIKLKVVHHIAIICSNYEQSKKFYVDTLGLTILSEHYRRERDSYKLDLALNNIYQIELFSFPNPVTRPTQPEATGLRHLAFTVEDLTETLDCLLQKGVPHEPVRTDEITGKRFAFIFDPDRLPIELYEA